MAMKKVNFYFPEELLQRLKALSERTGAPLAELIRRATEAFLRGHGL